MQCTSQAFKLDYIRVVLKRNYTRDWREIKIPLTYVLVPVEVLDFLGMRVDIHNDYTLPDTRVGRKDGFGFDNSRHMYLQYMRYLKKIIYKEFLIKYT